MERQSTYMQNGEKQASYIAALSSKPLSNGIFTIVRCDHRYTEFAGKKERSGVRVYRRHGENGTTFYAMCPVCDIRTVECYKAGDALAQFAGYKRYRTNAVFDTEESFDE